MKKTEIIKSFPKEIFRLKEMLGGIINEEYGVYKLKLDNTFGSGLITQYALNEGITAINFNVTLNEDLVYKIGDKNNNLLYFIYCTEGISYFKSSINEKYLKIEELRPSVIGCFNNDDSQLNIKKNINFIFNLIAIDKDSYFTRFYKNSSEITVRLQSLLKSFDTLGSQLFQCSYNLKISDYLRIVNSITVDHSISNILKIESNFKNILAHHIDQFYNEIHEENSIATLTKTELQKIRQLTEYIIQYPEIEHSIGTLCSKTAMSPAKLQEGFKGMHNTTVANFIRNIRVEKAEKLLIDTDLNISEIVYTIGLTSRSYFCKIFKKKYDFSPKRYRKIIRSKPQNIVMEQML